MAARVSSWINRLNSYSSIKVLKGLVFPLLVSKMVLPPQIQSVLSCQLTQILWYIFPNFYCQTNIPEQACIYCRVGIKMRCPKSVLEWAKGTVNYVPVSLDLCRESRELIVWHLKSTFLCLLRDAAVFPPAYPRRVRNVSFSRILRGVQHAPTLFFFFFFC